MREYCPSKKHLLEMSDEKLGWAITEQLDNILSGEPLKDQNANALYYIKRRLLKHYECYGYLVDDIERHLKDISYEE